MSLGINNILVWIRNYNKTNIPIPDNQIAGFIKELHSKIMQMDFSVNKGTTVIAYSGTTNGNEAWKVAEAASVQAGNKAMYISDLPAGQLIAKYRKSLKNALGRVVGDNDSYIEQIISGYKDGKRLPGGTCGFGNNLLSLDDLVSSKFSN